MKAILSFFLFLISFVAQAQQPKLYASKSENGIFIEHKVKPKENWYSVGRMYSINPKEIATFNELSMDKGLKIDQQLRVPLNTSNFIQTGTNDGVPVYHKVQAKEGLLKVASTYGMSLAGIKNLNGLNTDQINAGVSLIIGYLGPTMQNSTVSIATKTEAQVSVTEQVSETPVQNNKVAVPSSEGKQTAPKEMPKEASAKPVVKTPAPVNQSQVPVAETKSTASTSNNFFATGFSQQTKDGKEQKIENPSYGIFKSSSGWQDGKYYLLMNDVVPGTIVKISAAQTGKVIYAKVLGAVPPGKESEGMLLRLSNAAAAALGVESAGALSIVWHK